jgi:hypothetical protein
MWAVTARGTREYGFRFTLGSERFVTKLTGVVSGSGERNYKRSVILGLTRWSIGTDLVELGHSVRLFHHGELELDHRELGMQLLHLIRLQLEQLVQGFGVCAHVRSNLSRSRNPGCPSHGEGRTPAAPVPRQGRR